MLVKDLSLSNFRNYSSLQVSFEKGLNFIVGKNGSGKTNLIEAIYFLALSKSFKKCQDNDLIRTGQEQCELALNYETGEEEEHRIGATIFTKGKSFYLDNEKVPQLSKILGKLSVVGYEPNSVFLFKGEPSERRQFLDETLGCLSKGYLYTLGRYKKILKERNIALSGLEYDEDIVRVLTSELINGDYIISKQRNGLVSKLAKRAKEIFSRLEPGKVLELKYTTTLPTDIDQEQFQTEVKKIFENKKSEERLKKMTLIGVHRDDLKAYIDGQELGTFCSQGQNRLATLAIKMAVSDIIYDLLKEKPIVLLDDVLSDLDEERQSKLVEFIQEQEQVFVTVADDSKLDRFENKTVYNVIDNTVIRR